MHSLWVKSGLAGVASVVCYFVAVVIPWPNSQFGTSAELLVVSGFPILGIVFSYGIHSVVAAEKESTANRLGFVFAVAAFTMLLGMIIAQLAIGAGIGEMTKGLEEPTAKALRRGLRLIDLGLDVAWDFLIGTAMMFWGLAMRRVKAFGHAWGMPLVILGLALIVLNASTFPWPPDSHGLVDIGPLIALFLVAMAVRLILLGRMPQHDEAAEQAGAADEAQGGSSARRRAAPASGAGQASGSRNAHRSGGPGA